MSFFDYPNEPPASSGTPELLLADASDEEWATLLRHTRYRRFGPGDEVVTAGALDQSLYLVLEGQLEVLAEHGRRRYRRIALVDAGSVIGELSFFDGGARSALVRADDARACGRTVAGRIRFARGSEPGPGQAAAVRPRADPGAAAARSPSRARPTAGVN